jgi:hypothetical protein
MHHAKTALIYAIILAIPYFTFKTFFQEKPQTIDSLRAQTQDARDREIQAQKDREKSEDDYFQALYLECFDKETSQTGSRFDEKQRRAYECYRTKINS